MHFGPGLYLTYLFEGLLYVIELSSSPFLIAIMWKNNIFSVSRCAVTNGIMDDGKSGDLCDKKKNGVEQKRTVPFLFQFLTCVLNRAKFLPSFPFF